MILLRMLAVRFKSNDSFLYTHDPLGRYAALSDASFELVPPAAGALIEALRGIGYSVSTAMADLIDNSISARADNIWLTFTYAAKDSSISILDDGHGMALPDLVKAMTVGARSPTQARAEGDLGRFGLGLKTASFSQCRRLTVASRQSGSTSIRTWDLDHVAQTNDWQLLSRRPTCAEDHLVALERQSSGTLVVLEKLDRIIEPQGDAQRSEGTFLAVIDRVEEHLAMVFHRYLEGTVPELRIFINGSGPASRVKPWDPFMSALIATAATPQERIASAGGLIELRGFVLPHKDFLTEAEYRSGGGPEGWTAQQGFYVYRNRRMLVAGGWLGLGDERAWTREEPFKLARVRLDIPSTADEEWKIDIKKSVARLPHGLRPRVKALAGNVRVRARQVFAYRGFYGRVPVATDLRHAWESVATGSAAAYKINRDHPAIQRLAAAAISEPDSVEAALRIVEETVPVQRIWLDTMEQGEVKTANFAAAPSDEIMAVLLGLYGHLTSRVGLTPDLARKQLLATEPFQGFPNAVASLGRSPVAGETL